MGGADLLLDLPSKLQIHLPAQYGEVDVSALAQHHHALKSFLQTDCRKFSARCRSCERVSDEDASP
jgi:hypothetical protein